MSVFLEPSEAPTNAGWHVFGGPLAIPEALAQGVRAPAAPAAQGAEWTEGGEGINILELRLSAPPPGTEPVEPKLWLYVGHLTAGRWQYGWGVLGNHAQGFHSFVPGWQALPIVGAAMLSELWIEIQGTGPVPAGFGEQLFALYAELVSVPAMMGVSFSSLPTGGGAAGGGHLARAPRAPAVPLSRVLLLLGAIVGTVAAGVLAMRLGAARAAQVARDRLTA